MTTINQRWGQTVAFRTEPNKILCFDLPRSSVADQRLGSKNSFADAERSYRSRSPERKGWRSGYTGIDISRGFFYFRSDMIVLASAVSLQQYFSRRALSLVTFLILMRTEFLGGPM